MKLRPYQAQALEEVRGHFAAGRKRVIVCSPTGSGKTVLGAHAVKAAAQKGQHVLWVAHREELVGQAARAIHKITGVLPGIIQGAKKADPNALVQVASIQTLTRRGQTPPGRLLILDEAHRMLANGWQALLETYVGAYFLGMTATPERGDGRGMGELVDALVPTVQPRQLIQDGVLVPCEIIAPASEVDGGIACDPVDAYMAWARGRRAVIFCQTKEHARQVAEKFKVNGVSVGVVTDNTPTALRKSIYAGVASGAIKALVNVFVATEGLDIPALEVCIIARTMGHSALYIQCVGRAVRSAPGKGSAMLIDLKGVVEKYGLPDAPRTYSLDGDEAVTVHQDPTEKKRLTCPSCGSLRSGPVCPVCALATPSERPAVPEVQHIALRPKVMIDRSDRAAAAFIDSIHTLAHNRTRDFARVAHEEHARRFGSAPDHTWMQLYADYLRGTFLRKPLPAWWPASVRDPRYVKKSVETVPVAAE